MKLSNQLRRKSFPTCFLQGQGQGHTSRCNGVLQHVVWARLGLAWRGFGVAKASSGAGLGLGLGLGLALALGLGLRLRLEPYQPTR